MFYFSRQNSCQNSADLAEDCGLGELGQKQLIYEMDYLEFNITFLEYIREIPALWQPSDGLYLNRKIKNAAWDEIATKLKLLYNCEVTSGKKFVL